MLRRLAQSVLSGLLSVWPISGAEETIFNPPDTSQFLRGRFVYQKNCLVCHGRRGDGRGEMGLSLKPRPRDFTAGIFKFRSTPSGALPTEDDLTRTIRQGIAGSAMPAFGALPERELRAVIQYVKSFSSKWNDRANFAAPVPLPQAPAWIRNEDELVRRTERGRTLFTTMCAPCHGDDGAGNGRATKEMLDAWGQPIAPADLRQTQLRSGPELRDLYRVLVTGINGTPMPSFADGTTEEQRWELAAYIAQLRRGFRTQPASGL